MTTAETDLGFPTKGSLKRVPFSSLLRDIAGAKATGSLYLMGGETKKVVFFIDGLPTVVRSNLATEFLGQILTEQGMITQEQCDNTLEAIRRTGKKQGELLVEMGILSEHNLRYGLQEQLRRKLFEIFGWDEGRFQFKSGAEPGITGTPPPGTTEALILSAIQERFTDERAREALKAWSDKFPLQNPRWTGDPATLELLPEELYFLRCLDGSRTTDELLSRRLELEVPLVSTLLLGLISAGVVEPQDTKSPRRLAPLRPNLAPPSTPEEQLWPGFEVASTIGEYEDTPLPSRLPTDLGASSSKNPRVPILPTEDEEMFRGFNVDESIVADPRNLRVRARPTPDPATPSPSPKAVTPDSTISSADFDAETDFSDIHDSPIPTPVPTPASTPAPTPTPAPAPVAEAPKQDSGKHKLGAPPGLASLLRKDARPDLPQAPAGVVASTPTPAPEPAAAVSHTSAAIALLEDAELPDDLGDPDDDLLGGEEALEELEELEELDDDIIEDEEHEGDEPAAEPPTAAVADEHEEDDDHAAEPDPLAALGDLADEPPTSLPPASLAPEPTTDLPEEPGDLGDLGDLDGGLADGSLPDLGAADLGAADLGAADLDDGDDLLAGVDDDLLLAGDEPLPDLGDLDALDLGDEDADLGDLGGDLPGDDAAEAAGDDELPDDLGGDLPGGDDELGGELDGDIDGDIDGEFADLDDEPELAELDEEDGYADDEPVLSSAETTYVGPADEPTSAEGGAEAYAAVRYAEADAAMREGDYDTAVALFEDAYNTGYDTADLHAHLAFARYRASGGDPEIAQNSLELLDYAESMNPSLAIIQAYRGAIYVGLGATDSARECFERALYLDPYCELALEYRESV